MSRRDCPADRELALFLSGLLQEPGLLEVESHLLECESCVLRSRGLSADDTLVSAMRLRNAEFTFEEESVVRRVIHRVLEKSEFDNPAAATLVPTGSIATREAQLLALESCFSTAQHSEGIGHLGGFCILRRLGHGGMGAVYEALETSLERRVALKLMLPRYSEDGDARARFQREARAIAAIRNPHVVTIHQVGEEAGVLFIAQELLVGETLQSCLDREGSLSPMTAARIGREIAVGLAAAHARGILHRDIKPSNIWLEAPDSHVKLLDFGLALPLTRETELTDPGARMGTPAYFSPEQAAGTPLDERSDLFSLGVVFYRMLTGTAPFPGDNLFALLQSLAIDTPQPPRNLNPEVPAAFSNLTMRLLDKKPENRPDGAAVVVRMLAETEVLKPSGTLPPQKSVARLAGLGMSGVGILCLLAAIFLKLKLPGGTEITLDIDKPSQLRVPQDLASSDEKPAVIKGWQGWPADAPPPAIAPFDAYQAQRYQDLWAAYLGLPVEFTDTNQIRFRLIPPGEFSMGMAGSELQDVYQQLKEKRKLDWELWDLKWVMTEAPQRRVVLTKPFYLQISEMTVGLFEEYVSRSGAVTDAEREGHGVRAGPNNEVTGHPGKSWRGATDPLHPLQYISWNDAQACCRFLSGKQKSYRLPTEAEWEFACRAGTTTRYWTGNELNNSMESVDGSAVQRAMVFKPNPFGLFDMHGLRREYCSTAFDASSEELAALVDPENRTSNKYYVSKGGSSENDSLAARSTARMPGMPSARHKLHSFRVVLSVDGARAMLVPNGL